ncbi:amidohydrolase family protein [Pseudorhodoplanes sp.]|uniref:amidohydrolase family protein n=1 Tax=Pseudorhodoplanes sp. TaxID=1934341 RepID=UPI003D142D50
MNYKMSATASTSSEGASAADTIVVNIDWLITVDEQRRVIRDAAIAIKHGKIVAVGKSSEIRSVWSSDRIYDAADTVVTPGFVDNHLHSSFQLSRGLADEANAQSFLFDHMYPYEGAMQAEDVYVSASLAAVELLTHGVTCFIDPGNYHPGATVDAVCATGMRLVIARSSFDKTKSVLGVLPQTMIETTEDCLQRTDDLFAKYAGSYAGKVSVSASFRGLNNASDELILGLKSLSDEYEATLQTHACFSYSTHDSSLAQYGLSEIERLEALGVLDDRMLLVHSGWLEPGEVALLARRKATLVCAPSSSIHNGYGNIAVGKLPELMALGVNVSLGSDHACSGSVDMVQEMRYCACGYKEVRLNPRVMPPETALEMATINGARGAGLADRIGSIEVGKEADFVIFDSSLPEWQPLYNPVSNLVYSATGRTVRDVFVAGDQVVRDGRLVNVNQSEIMRDVTKTAHRIASRLDMRKILKLKWPVE